MRHEQALLEQLDHALTALKRTTGADGRVAAFDPQTAHAARPDAHVEFVVDLTGTGGIAIDHRHTVAVVA